MSAVVLLAFGAQADAIPQTEAALPFAKTAAGSSTPLDVSAHAILRLDLTAQANLGANPVCALAFETAPSASGPWTTLLARQLVGEAWPAGNVVRVVLDSFDKFVRVTWSARARAHAPLNFQLGVAGDAKPDAA